jgi:hypothetical protein
MAVEVEISLGFAPCAHFSSDLITLPTYGNRVYFLIGRAPSKEVFYFSLGAGDYRSYFGESTPYRMQIASVDKMIYLSS